MRLIDDSLTDFDRICDQFRWSIPEHLNIAHQVCERHRQRAGAVFFTVTVPPVIAAATR